MQRISLQAEWQLASQERLYAMELVGIHKTILVITKCAFLICLSTYSTHLYFEPKEKPIAAAAALHFMSMQFHD